jgi:hypothetical protein
MVQSRNNRIVKSKAKVVSPTQREYVANANSAINSKINQKLQTVTKTILENIHGIRSIMIAGGFGKGEGSIRITEEGKVICLRDFDIICIADYKPSNKAVEEVEDKVYRSLGIPNPASSDFERGQSFAVDLKFFRENDLIYPDIYFYDLKAASQVLWGEDLRNVNPWTKQDVPLSSGLRLLFEKVTGLLGYFNVKYVESVKPTNEEEGYLLSECRKTFIEIGTALCILAGKYEPKFSQRAQILKDIYHAKFPKLFQVIPELPNKVIEYTDLRLNPKSPHVTEDPIDLWFLARKYIEETLRFYLEAYCGRSILDWSSLPRSVKVLSPEYYKPFLGPLLSNRLHLSNEHVLHLAGFLYPGLTNIEYSYVTTSNGEGNPWKPLQSWHVSPSLKYFTAGALLLFSLSKDGSVDKDLLKTAQEELGKLVYSNVPSFDKRSWEKLRIRFLKARDLYRGYHFVR